MILAQYDDEIERHQKTLQDLIADRSKVQDYVDGCRTVFAPVRRLPPEILGQIFMPFSSPFAVPGDAAEELNSLAHLDLLRLSQVCSHWHRLIMGTPSLWSHIAVNVRCWPRKAPGYAPFLRLLDASLQRGADYPLSIRFSTGSSIRDADGAILLLLAEHSQRWQHLDLDSICDCFAPGAHCQCAGKA
ncbi:hypothetical protein C8R43DRAFT_888252 [Mycena crocata]|nr:hypothetical protein C8R43DRAFT_888252 [Mycena crocata]